MPTIMIRTRSVYGVSRIYPANAAAELLASIAGTRTLSERNLMDAIALGHQVQQQFGSGDCRNIAHAANIVSA